MADRTHVGICTWNAAPQHKLCRCSSPSSIALLKAQTCCAHTLSTGHNLNLRQCNTNMMRLCVHCMWLYAMHRACMSDTSTHDRKGPQEGRRHAGSFAVSPADAQTLCIAPCNATKAVGLPPSRVPRPQIVAAPCASVTTLQELRSTQGTVAEDRCRPQSALAALPAKLADTAVGHSWATTPGTVAQRASMLDRRTMWQLWHTGQQQNVSAAGQNVPHVAHTLPSHWVHNGAKVGKLGASAAPSLRFSTLLLVTSNLVVGLPGAFASW